MPYHHGQYLFLWASLKFTLEYLSWSEGFGLPFLLRAYAGSTQSESPESVSGHFQEAFALNSIYLFASNLCAINLSYVLFILLNRLRVLERARCCQPLTQSGLNLSASSQCCSWSTGGWWSRVVTSLSPWETCRFWYCVSIMAHVNQLWHSWRPSSCCCFT